MKKAKAWWSDKAWPWLKANWIWVVFPFGALVLLARLFGALRPRADVIDPTAKADARAETEARTRSSSIESLRRDFASDTETLTKEHEQRQAHLDDELKKDVLDNISNPDALVEEMKRTGKGQ